MPVDAVLIGTVAMATAESTASPSVKAALVAAAGSDGPVAHRGVRGGVTSGRSGLGADIHYLDNHASRVAALLEDVAGDGARVADRHDEIAEALANTAKPYFGDPTTMTYVEALERFVELTALGRHGRYEDGRWLDRSHRRLFADLLQRWEARCCAADEGEVESIFADVDVEVGELDDPAKAVERFVRAHPVGLTAEVEPSDAAFLVELCDRPGKPVPFVVAIDAEVRRRYLADSLWQAHSEIWDAEQVLVIPGPVALAGLTRADEPVAELLDRINAAAAMTATEATGSPAGSADAAGPDAVEVLSRLSTVVSGGVSVPSPIRSMIGSEPARRTVDGDRVRSRWVHDAADGAVEELQLSSSVRPIGPEPVPVHVELRWPPLAGVDGDGTLCFTVHVHEHHGVPVATVDDESFRAAQGDLLRTVVAAATTARDRNVEPASGSGEAYGSARSGRIVGPGVARGVRRADGAGGVGLDGATGAPAPPGRTAQAGRERTQRDHIQQRDHTEQRRPVDRGGP